MNALVCGAHRYVPTEDDRLWLLRAVEAEGANEFQVAQTLVNCFAYLHSRRPGAAPSLRWLVRNYAQPVNPRWYPDGDLHKKWAARGKDNEISARRRRDIHSTRTHFGSLTVSAVDVALNKGREDIPACCTDYAAAWIDASAKYKALTEAAKGFNRLWTRDPKWSGYTVEPLCGGDAA